MRFDFDPDFRPQPKTDRFCCVCQRDIKHNTAGVVHLGDGCFEAIDSTEDDFDASFTGRLGPECVKKIPSELVTKTKEILL